MAALRLDRMDTTRSSCCGAELPRRVCGNPTVRSRRRGANAGHATTLAAIELLRSYAVKGGEKSI